MAYLEPIKEILIHILLCHSNDLIKMINQNSSTFQRKKPKDELDFFYLLDNLVV